MNLTSITNLFSQAESIWVAGGWGMIALAVNALVMFGMGIFVFMKLVGSGILSSPETSFRRWKAGRPASGPLEAVIGRAMAEGTETNVELFFDALGRSEISPFERDLKAMRVSVSTAPLLGLLGTVTGMLATFSALATGGGGDKTMGMVAGGISEALITTETGLVLGLAGMMFEFALKRQQDRLLLKYACVETLCIEAARRTDVVRTVSVPVPASGPAPVPRPAPVRVSAPGTDPKPEFGMEAVA
jgi:biopolymer transport protein ExbB